MAKIKGIQLKAIKEGFGHDGGGFSANIYLNNKKIGSVLDDGWGGPLQVNIETELETFNKTADEYKKETKEELFSGEEKIIYELLELSDLEKTFKKAVKKGYSTIVCLDYTPRDEDGKEKLDVPVPHPRIEVYQCTNEKQVEKLINDKKPEGHETYRSLEDFIIA